MNSSASKLHQPSLRVVAASASVEAAAAGTSELRQIGQSVPLEPQRVYHSLLRQRLEEGSTVLLGKFADLGKWWSESPLNGNNVLNETATLSGAPKGLQAGYQEQVTRMIVRAEQNAVDFGDGVRRTPQALKSSSWVARGMGFSANLLNAGFGVFDLAQTYYQEGYAGPKTNNQIIESTAQGVIGGAIGASVGTGIAAAGLGLVGAPLLAGAVVTVGTGYLVGAALDRILG